MKQRVTELLVAALLLLGGVPWAMAEGKIQLRHSDGSVTPLGGVDDAAKVTKSTTDAGEDVSADVQKTEERYLTIPTGGTTAMIAADQLYKSGPGYVKGITCYSDATATAGTIALLDNTAAGSGNTLWSFDVLAVAYNTPFTVDLQTPFSVGLYLDFTTTADVKCMVRYR
jgi:hypothetical protein